MPGSYLDAEAVLAAAQQTDAEAIHPGYGFLSENAAFARAVTEAGIRWVGPSPDVIESMGDKIAAKRSPSRPACRHCIVGGSAADAPTIEATVGYPLLVKASAGGGGKGMRIVESADDLADAVQSAQREALSGFGDETVFLERYVASSRHIEIQILGDAHGNVVHLGERECSIQRRHQKIVEESPSPVVDAEMRTAMGEAALSLARHMGYESAGTVEFLVDDATREFFFLEVNTRLQVEHPVTEEVTGIDLVREQLRVAGGAELGYDQDDIDWSGSAIEVRLYAEDPDNDFLPATGTLSAYRPADEPVVRWDSGVEEGSVVGVDFDPMLAKVIAHGPTRAEAAGRWHWPSNECISAVSSPTVTSWLRPCATRRSSPATPPPTSSIASTPPARRRRPIRQWRRSWRRCGSRPQPSRRSSVGLRSLELPHRFVASSVHRVRDRHR